MAKKDFGKLSYEESGLKSHWYDVVRYIKKDLAYIWSEEVKKDFKKINEELERIKYILAKLSSYYKEEDKETYKKEISNINSLSSYLKEIKASKGWVRGAHNGLRRVIADIEKEKTWLRQYHGDLHVHSQDSLNGIPISGSNCGALPVVEIIRYAGTRMGQQFIAITDHSRDADPEKALEYWAPKGRHDVGVYGDGRMLGVYARIDTMKKPPLKVFKGIEVNLLPNGEFDSKLPASLEVQCVNCSIHPNLDRTGFAKIRKDPKLYTALVLRGIQNPHTNIICHLGAFCEDGLLEEIDWDKICQAAIKHKVAIELNIGNLMHLIFDNGGILDLTKFPADSTDYRDYFRKKIRKGASKYMPLIGNPKIRQRMKPYFTKGLKVTINTDLHKHPFIRGESAKRGKWFRRFDNISPDNKEFRIKRIRFFRCLKIAEKEFQKLFRKTGIKLENIINSYPTAKLAAFLRKRF